MRPTEVIPKKGRMLFTNAVIKNGLPNGGKPTARESNLFYYKERIGLPNMENRLKVIPKKGTLEVIRISSGHWIFDYK